MKLLNIICKLLRSRRKSGMNKTTFLAARKRLQLKTPICKIGVLKLLNIICKLLRSRRKSGMNKTTFLAARKRLQLTCFISLPQNLHLPRRLLHQLLRWCHLLHQLVLQLEHLAVLRLVLCKFLHLRSSRSR